jgi:UDP-GlcNAc:undecaprenyl-phosphate/decaprenyl-phosphate GlcNAc-1-phosphate transferase
MGRLLGPAALTLLLAVGLTPLTRAGARRLGLVAAPRTDRWHRTPTATVGGVAVFLAFLSGVWLACPAVANAWPIIGAASLLFAAGLVDDVVQLPPLANLGVQVLAAAIIVGAGLRLPWTLHPALNALVTLVWLVGITNAINLLDNMDGLAGGIVVIACVFLTVTFVLNGQHAAAALAMALGGAVLGFLVFNFNPASIFMGDCGSMFLGALLGGLALLSEYGRSRNLTAVLFTPVMILVIPILDTCLVTVTRKLAGRPVSVGGRDHSSHRLVALGVSERRAVVILYALATLSGVCALLVRGLKNEVAIPALGVFAIGMTLFGVFLGRVRVDEPRRVPAEHGQAPALPG